MIYFYKIAVDISTCMMRKAQERVKQFENPDSSSVSWIIHDLNGTNELLVNDSSVDAVISTLVIEHIASLDQFFKTIYKILKKNDYSWAFITAMHPNMYQAGSQAGFIIDQMTGDKLCGISYDHSIEDIIETAAKANLILVKYYEKGVENEEHAKQLGSRAKKWIGINTHASFLFKIRTN
jgi:ubiquinone/menaquinone biosynthesis C-methylase UbiE